MAMNHPVSELVSCIKNAQMARKEKTLCEESKLKKEILKLLKREGFIKDYSVVKGSDNFNKINIELSYHENKPVVRDIKVISKPGKRVYCGCDDIPKVYDGLGMVVLSTSKGILFDHEAKKLKVGGELLLKIF